MRQYTYSQSGQDMLADFLLQRHKLLVEGRPRTYLDIGACHPVDCNNTYHFYRKGWRGLCIEPNPALASVFAEHRPEDTLVSCAAGATEETLQMHMFSEMQWNTFDAIRVSRIERRYGGKVAYLGAQPVPVRRIDHILRDHTLSHIDLMSVDVEGHELSVFESCDFTTHRPRMILFENPIPFSELASNPVIAYLTARGYELLAHTGHDSFMGDTQPA